MTTPRLLTALGLLAALSITLADESRPRDPNAVAGGHNPAMDLGLLWVQHAAEYQALTTQVYAAAIRDLPRLIADESWSAEPAQEDAAHLPPAVILDVDETVVSNVDFQLVFERPFANWKLNDWTSRTDATPVAGVREFVAAARDAGATVFFVTNRPCEIIDGIDDPCPQKRATIDDIAEVGIATDAAHVFLSGEQGWNREKLTRRLHIAKTHRIVMLIGDDFADFVPCSRSKVVPPCREPGTRAGRLDALEKHGHLWGNGWYVLPNPMHGSWTGVR